MPNTEYITIEGDRWDTIAFKAYGDATLYPTIQSANPFIPLIDTFEGGVRIQVPILEDVESTDLSLLPPWKRVDTSATQKAQNQVEEQKTYLGNGGSGTDAGSFDDSFD